MIRSILFAIAFYATTAVMLLGLSWLLLAPRSWAMAAGRAHARASLWLQGVIAGTDFVVRGREKLPAGAVLVASKHQSAWDTLVLMALLRDPALVMKQELKWIPVYGWFSAKFEMIFVRREAGPKALRRMARDARERAAAGREIVIFPEGTRRAPGAPPDYKPGVIMLYESLGLPCCPIALNSGLYWPRRSWLRYPGTIIVEFLDPLPPGLPRKEFTSRLQRAIEGASDRLLAEAAGAANPPPLPETARIRLDQMAGHAKN